MREYSLYDGKYSVTNNNGILTTKRHGVAWPEKDRDLVGDGFVLALVHRIEELEETKHKILSLPEMHKLITCIQETIKQYPINTKMIMDMITFSGVMAAEGYGPSDILKAMNKSDFTVLPKEKHNISEG